MPFRMRQIIRERGLIEVFSGFWSKAAPLYIMVLTGEFFPIKTNDQIFGHCVEVGAAGFDGMFPAMLPQTHKQFLHDLLGSKLIILLSRRYS